MHLQTLLTQHQRVLKINRNVSPLRKTTNNDLLDPRHFVSDDDTEDSEAQSFETVITRASVTSLTRTLIMKYTFTTTVPSQFLDEAKKLLYDLTEIRNHLGSPEVNGREFEDFSRHEDSLKVCFFSCHMVTSLTSMCLIFLWCTCMLICMHSGFLRAMFAGVLCSFTCLIKILIEMTSYCVFLESERCCKIPTMSYALLSSLSSTCAHGF
jgi:hypothetical protein